MMNFKILKTQKLKNLKTQKLTLWQYSAILSLFNLVMFNVPLLGFVNDNAEGWFLTSSIAVLVFTLNLFACYLVCYTMRMVGRILIAICNVLSTLATYYVVTYNVLMVQAMIGNVFNTNYAEASGFMTWKMWVTLLLVGILPLAFILGVKVKYDTRKAAGKWLGGSLAASLLVIGLNYNSIMWIGRHDMQLGGLAMPWSYLVNTVRYFSIQHDLNRQEELLPDATFSDDDKCVVVLVIGESARQANWSLYGYERNTNPLLSQVEGLHVFNAHSCATYTTAGVRAILEHEDTGTLYEILPNYLWRNGADVEWRTTNWGEPPVHTPYLKNEELKNLRTQELKNSRTQELKNSRAQELENSEEDEYDGVLLNGLKERIQSSTKPKTLIVLHTSTSHGPAYCNRYPERFGVYTPVCDNVEEATKDAQKLINAYDNSILYTDYLLNEVIETLKTFDDRKTTMFYISDHGESLGEGNVYMHGVPMNLAPEYQYVIPCVVWTSDTTRTPKPQGLLTLGTSNGYIDQHCVFHTVLGLMGCKSPVYKPENDLFE